MLERGALRLRPLRARDREAWFALRRANADWLRPWEATVPPGAQAPELGFAGFVRFERRQRRRLEAVPLVMEIDGELVGRIVLAGLVWGAQRSGTIGYWVTQERAGQGLAPTAAAMVAEYGFALGLHRLEIAIRPENSASLRVARKLGFTEEGIRRSHLYIDGAWRDHLVFAMTQEDPRIGRYWTEPS